MNPIDILLAEDDDKLRRALATWLGLVGYRVTQAPDGESAIELLERTPFAVVLTDIIMGDVSGIEVLHTARGMPNRPSVILLTGHGSLDTAVAAVRAGAHDYLLKPCDEDALLACVASAAERHQNEQRAREAAQVLADYTKATSAAIAKTEVPPAMLRIGEITIGLSRKQVWFQGQSVQLTPIEYALLSYLAERVEHVHRYRDIARATHQLDLDDAEAKGLLRTHFLNLRKKLAPEYFLADRGIGYVMVVPEGSDKT